MTLQGLDEATARHRGRVQERTDRIVRGWLLLYAVTWVAEGALRKWFAVGLSDLIYFGRDVITVAALLMVMSNGVPFRKAGRFTAALVVSLLAAALACAQVVVTSEPLAVYVLGLRDLLMPVIALALLYLSDHRVAALARVRVVVLLAAPVEAVLTILQVTSPSTSFWNDLGNDQAIQLYTAGDVVRGSGSFTSPAGLTAFVTLAFALALAGLLAGAAHRRLHVLGMVSSVVILLLGGSRGAILAAAIVLVAALLWTVVAARRFSTGLRLVIAGVATYVAGRVVVHFFPTVFSAFLERAETAGASEDPLRRIWGDFTDYLSTSTTPLGDGIGNHLLAGQAAGAHGGWIENELIRWAVELGIVGFVLVMLRQVLALVLLAIAWRRSSRTRQPLAWCMTAALAPTILYGALGSTPTQQGFTILGLAFLMASFGDPEPESEPEREPHAREVALA